MPSILETFMILFDSDASGVKKGAQESDAALDQLEQRITNTDHSATQLGNSFMHIAREAAAMLAGFYSAHALIHGFFAGEEFADNLRKSAALIDVNIEELGAWAQAAKGVGGSADGLMGSVTNLATGMATLDATGKSRVLPFFRELGISMTDTAGKSKEPLDLMLELSEAFEHMTKAESLGFGRKLGLDIGTIMLLQQGRRGVEELIRKEKELGTVTAAQAKVAHEFFDQWDHTKTAFRNVGLALGEYLLPALTKFLELMQEGAVWVSHNHDALHDLGMVASAVAFIYTARLLPAIYRVGLAMLAAHAPMILVIGALGALYLLWNDLMTYVRGGKTFFDAGQWEWFLGKIKQINIELEKILRFFHLDKKWDETGEWGARNLLPENSRAPGYEKISDFDMAVSTDSDMHKILRAKNAISLIDRAPISAIGNSSVYNSPVSRETNLNIGDINIQTQATDSDEIARSFNEALERNTKQALTNYDDGLRY